ncbi:hypothetical protein [Clostridium sp.]|uniref:hypothetical protein n=1 Tax=Clostridium sp. TaxID=1506 RepID=UPI0032180C09
MDSNSNVLIFLKVVIRIQPSKILEEEIQEFKNEIINIVNKSNEEFVGNTKQLLIFQ